MSYGFDETITKMIDGEQIEYGIIFGNKNIVFIKVGAEQSIHKWQDHFQIFAELAERAHKYFGATVICASNPFTPHAEIDEKMIRHVASEQGFEDFKLYFWGISDGAYSNLNLAKRFPETVKFIGLNTSFISFDDFEKKLQALPSVKKFLIYGTEDDDFNIVFPALRDKQNDFLKTMFVSGADHRFSNLPLPIINSMNLIEDGEPKEVVSFGRYWKGTGLESTPIDWLVLEDNDYYLFVVCKETVISKPFSSEDEDTWANSDIRKWLNEDFLNKAFDDYEKKWILDVNNTTFYESHNELPKLTENTSDKIFLLDYDNFEKHFDTMESTITEQSRYAIDTLKEAIGVDFNNDWWLRNGGDLRNARLMCGNGSSIGFLSNRCVAGVRPAMYINKKYFQQIQSKE